MASFDQRVSRTNLSRSLSLTIINDNLTEIPIQMNLIYPMEFFVPRDPNLPIPSMLLCNVTNNKEKNLFFDYHLIDLPVNNRNLTYSLHLEIQPMQNNISYGVIYQFDIQPAEFPSIDHWITFCPRGHCEFFLRFIS